MDNCYLLAFWIVALICLIAMAAALTSMAANNYSFMENRDLPHQMRFAGEPSDNISRFAGDGQNAPPVFYDIGDSAAINKHLQAVKHDKEGMFNPADKNKLSPAFLQGAMNGQ